MESDLRVPEFALAQPLMPGTTRQRPWGREPKPRKVIASKRLPVDAEDTQ